MTTMEDTVRPFASVAFMPGSTTLPYKRPANFIECKLGGSGGTSTSFSMESYGTEYKRAKDEFKESSRKSTLVRVENPDDASQYVEFCRADEITLTSKDKSKQKQRTSSYDLSGGMHGDDRQHRKYEYQYPNNRDCKSREPPLGGK